MNDSISTRATRAQPLLNELEAFVAADERETSFKERMLLLLNSPPDPFDRDHYLPGHFTASSFVLSPNLDALLLIFHSKLRRWLQPGGHVDPRDTDMLAAARREATEETGIVALQPLGAGLFDVDIHTIPARNSSPQHEHFDLRYVLRAESTEFSAGSDALAARWVPLARVHTVESDESVQRAVRKLQHRH
jgi:8-oxo-dGTP pyrophosphatase MutT (NUDIX family)